MTEKLLGPLDLEYHATHLRAEIDRLLAVGSDYLQRLEEKKASGEPFAILLQRQVASELEAIARALDRAQLALVHPTDERYAAAQSLLRATGANAARNPLARDRREDTAA